MENNEFNEEEILKLFKDKSDIDLAKIEEISNTYREVIIEDFREENSKIIERHKKIDNILSMIQNERKKRENGLYSATFEERLSYLEKINEEAKNFTNRLSIKTILSDDFKILTSKRKKRIQQGVLESSIFFKIIDADILESQGKVEESKLIFDEDEQFYRDNREQLENYLDLILLEIMVDYDENINIEQKSYYVSIFLTTYENLENSERTYVILQTSCDYAKSYIGMRRIYNSIKSKEMEAVVIPAVLVEINKLTYFEGDNLSINQLLKYSENDVKNLLSKCRVIEYNEKNIRENAEILNVMLSRKK